jgi:ferredoxin
MRRILLLAAVVVLMVFVVEVGQAQAATDQSPVTQEVTGTQPITATLTIPFLDEWLSSAHADFAGEPFNHWNEESPPEIPTTCAKCHSQAGYLDYIGADGTEANTVDDPAPIGSVVTCVTCHNAVTVKKDSVLMPSGIELTGLGDESRCMECHQGRQSKVSVDAAIEQAAVDDDAISPDLSFRNIHYYAAAVTKFGTLAKGGYEYEGKSYDAFFAHVEGYQTCIQCHNTHTLKVKIDECATCHTNVESEEDLRDIRMNGSLVDYDGDGDVEEGISYELDGVREKLYANIQAYATEVVSTAIVYDPGANPYFFIDTNANGEADADEVNGDNRFASWTPRLLRAAYNYQTSIKDPGAFAHGGKYIIELLYDSTEDLGAAIAEPVDMTAMRRIDAGHFAGSEEAFRHWDVEGTVPGSCAKCHTAGGIPQLLAEGVTISANPSNGFQCTTCHNDLQEYTRHEFTEIRFPSGAMIDSGDPDTNLCMNCHQGRESTVSVDRLIGDVEPDATSESLRFLNVHYFAAGATRYGTEAKGAYEYEGKEYLGYFEHTEEADQCKECHNAHSLEVQWENCAECHDDVDIESIDDLANIRYYFEDWDGDGDDEEGIAGEIDTLREALYAAMQEYAAATVETGILYSPAAYPYFFVDTNGDGVADPDEVNSQNSFRSWTPRLLRAAYNYQYASKDPGAFAHNGQYIIQVLYDGLEDLGADVSDLTRP